MANKFVEYQLNFKKETDGAFIFIIPETGNEIMIPKSQCEIFVSYDDEPLIEKNLYTVSIAEWIAKKKKIDEGGEEQKTLKIRVILVEEREESIGIQYNDKKLWFAKSTIDNKTFPEEKEEFDLIVKEWLFNKKLEESNLPATGRRVVNKVKSSEDKNKDDEDIPY